MTASRKTNTSHAGRRRDHKLDALAWTTMLALSILFTIATAGIGAFAIGVVLIVGVIMVVVQHNERSRR